MNAGDGASAETGARALRRYIDGVEPAYRPLFERLHAVVLAAHPTADLSLAYGMPAYRVGRRRLSLGAWAHGVSVYGWRKDNDGGFVARHPDMVQGKGTIRITTTAAAKITDAELRALLGGALEP